MYGENGGSKLVEPGNVSGAASANASYWLTSSGPPTDAGRSLAALQPYVPSFEPQSTCTLAKTSNYNGRMHGKSAWRKRRKENKTGDERREKRDISRTRERERKRMVCPYQLPSVTRASRSCAIHLVPVDGARPQVGQAFGLDPETCKLQDQ